jgi:Arc/MetJ-type ribon-helix-helix transcriptional regulator
MNEDRMVSLNVRIPQNLKKIMRRYVTLDTHKDLSEVTRDAIREKIQRDAPDLYRGLFAVTDHARINSNSEEGPACQE